MIFKCIVLLVSLCLLSPGNLINITNVEEEEFAVMSDRIYVWEYLYANIEFEILMFMTYDGRLFMYTQASPFKASVPILKLLRDLADEGYTIEDVIVCVHNHVFSASFSTTDFQGLFLLKFYGFKGLYCVWVTPDKELIKR